MSKGEGKKWGRDWEDWFRRFRRVSVLKMAAIAPGTVCIDLGCGNGSFALPLLKLVGEKGVVYAIDVSEKKLKQLRAKKPPANLKLILADGARSGLHSSIADLCLTAFTLHELEEPHLMIEEAFRLLKAGGRILVVEWRETPPNPAQNPLKQEQARSLLQEAGFFDVITLAQEARHYVMLGRKYG